MVDTSGQTMRSCNNCIHLTPCQFRLDVLGVFRRNSHQCDDKMAHFTMKWIHDMGLFCNLYKYNSSSTTKTEEST